MKRLEAMIDELFGFHDFSPPMLLSDGPLQKYQDYAITHDKFGVELPPAPTAKGMRHGACETICIGVPLNSPST